MSEGLRFVLCLLLTIGFCVGVPFVFFFILMPGISGAVNFLCDKLPGKDVEGG